MADNFRLRDKGALTQTVAVGVDSAGNAMPAGLDRSTVEDSAGNLVSVIQTDGVNTWVQTVTVQANTPSAGLSKTTYGKPVKQ